MGAEFITHVSLVPSERVLHERDKNVTINKNVKLVSLKFSVDAYHKKERKRKKEKKRKKKNKNKTRYLG